MISLKSLIKLKFLIPILNKDGVSKNLVLNLHCYNHLQISIIYYGLKWLDLKNL